MAFFVFKHIVYWFDPPNHDADKSDDGLMIMMKIMITMIVIMIIMLTLIILIMTILQSINWMMIV